MRSIAGRKALWRILEIQRKLFGVHERDTGNDPKKISKKDFFTSSDMIGCLDFQMGL